MIKQLSIVTGAKLGAEKSRGKQFYTHLIYSLQYSPIELLWNIL